MKKQIFTLLGILFAFTLMAQEVPQKISYQGKLLENGVPVNGTKNFVFTIGSWTETISNVQVTDGLYSVTLGETNPILIDVFNNSSTASLEITVEGSQLSPQTEILSVPYAYKAEKSVDTEQIAGNPVSSSNPSTNQILKWDGLQWSLASDDSGGLPSGSAGGDLSGTYPNPVVSKIQNQSVSNVEPVTNQVLKWDGSQWVGATDETGLGGDDWGTQTIQSDATLSGDGSSGNPLSINQQGATTGQVLEWNGTAWAPATDDSGAGTGDDWGSQVVQSDETLSGTGTSISPLSIAQQGATTGQVLKWNGSVWVPGTDDTGSGGLTYEFYTAQEGGSSTIFLESGKFYRLTISSSWFSADSRIGTYLIYVLNIADPLTNGQPTVLTVAQTASIDWTFSYSLVNDYDANMTITSNGWGDQGLKIILECLSCQ